MKATQGLLSFHDFLFVFLVVILIPRIGRRILLFIEFRIIRGTFSPDESGDT